MPFGQTTRYWGEMFGLKSQGKVDAQNSRARELARGRGHTGPPSGDRP